MKTRTLVKIISLLRMRETELNQWIRAAQGQRENPRIEIATLEAYHRDLQGIRALLENEFSDDEHPLLDELKDPPTRGDRVASRTLDDATEAGQGTGH